MILVLGHGLVYWTGVLAGIVFLLSFLGCVCNVGLPIGRLRVLQVLRIRHRALARLAFLFILVHVSLAVLSGFGIAF